MSQNATIKAYKQKKPSFMESLSLALTFYRLWVTTQRGKYSKGFNNRQLKANKLFGDT